jgi:CDP-diacylglycerol--serine O-phosphatidyltransferase
MRMISARRKDTKNHKVNENNGSKKMLSLHDVRFLVYYILFFIMADKIRLATVPNIITCLNLWCGCMGIAFALLDGFTYAPMLFMLAAALFDFSDGFAARLLKDYSPVGKQLDSLADMVSFGTLPAVMIYNVVGSKITGTPDVVDMLLIFSPFLLTVFSALRLAKFNVDERQTASFIGLPTPANALFFASISIIYADNPFEGWMLLVLILLFSFLLVCEFPMFSFKVKNFLPQEYSLQLVFVLLSAIILLLCPLYSLSVFAVFAPVVLLYILLNVVKWIWSKVKISK